MKGTLRERLESRLVPGANGCLEFVGAHHRKGYGVIKVEGKPQRAHRVAWMLNHGDMPGLCVLHRCDNPKCCNLEHLFLGTHADNMADMSRKDRRSRVGNYGANRIVDKTMVIFMRELQMQDLHQAQIGECLGVDRTTVGRYLSGNKVAK